MPEEHEPDYTLKSTITELVIVGTLHAQHFQAQHYTPEALRRILLRLRPDAILVDLYSRFMEPGGTIRAEFLQGDCPENRVTNDVAIELGIKQIPFDREGRNEYYAETRYFERQDRFNAGVGEWIEREGPNRPALRALCAAMDHAAQCQRELGLRAAAEVVNSEAYDALIRIRRRLEVAIQCEIEAAGLKDLAREGRFFADEWDERNRIMADNIVRIAGTFAGQRLVVTTGAEHRYVLRERLADRPGIALKEFWNIG